MRNRKLVVGVLAHVDAGKTTLAESILYTSGSIRKLGRVDHKDAFLDTDSQERDRGITIFSKQAEFSWKGMDITLLDTPGHVDFSAEMERTLQVLDYAVLVISGADGVQGHVMTLWRLLERYQVPVFIFVNKMDQPGTEAEALLAEIKSRLGEGCVAFGRQDEAFYEDIAVCDEELLERYLAAEVSEQITSTGMTGDNAAIADSKVTAGNAAIVDGTETADNAAIAGGAAATDESRIIAGGAVIDNGTITTLIRQRKIFPCFFGSALKVEGVTELLDGLDAYTRMPAYGEAFGARVYKISRDAQGNRLTHVKITGGALKVKQTIQIHGSGVMHDAGRQYGARSAMDRAAESGTVLEEKVDQIRIYSGSKYQVEQEVSAGSICALTGPVSTFCGAGLGAEQESTIPLLEPVMTYRIVLPEGCDVHRMYNELCQLEEEEPQLHMVWKERIGEIHVQLMGEVQIEVLQHLIRERFGVDVMFDEGSIVYKETIASVVEGVGHYEPLRHYAEVHLLMEPGEAGSGLQFNTRCSEDVLDRNWQRLVLTHLEEKEHLGVLTGSPITDMQITLVAGRSHLKHTEGGDFRQATYRAVRQGLCKAQNVLLEPVYAFRLELPSSVIGRGMTDMQNKAAKFGAPETEGDYTVLTGTVPVSEMTGYQAEVLAYSAGKGRLHTELKGYVPCHNTDAVIEAIGYEAERDVENPCGSVFCAHGAGFVVEWDQVETYMHLDSVISQRDSLQPQEERATDRQNTGGYGSNPSDGLNDMENDFRTRHTDGAGMGRRIENRRTGAVADTIGQDEIEEIMNRTYGTRERKKQGWAKTIRAGQERAIRDGDEAGNEKVVGGKSDRDKTGSSKASRTKADAPQEEYLLVDGYNIIFAWDSLKDMAQTNLDSARGKLMDILSNFQGYRKMHLILVFDAYKVKGNVGSTVRYHNIDVVYTKEAETADQYIEKVTHEIGRKYRVRVATSDGLEQLIIMGAGAIRVSARELQEEVMAAGEEMRQMFLQGVDRQVGEKNYLLEGVSEDVAGYVERVMEE